MLIGLTGRLEDSCVKIMHQNLYYIFPSGPQNSQEKGMNAPKGKTATIPQEKHHLASPVRRVSVCITQRSSLEINNNHY